MQLVWLVQLTIVFALSGRTSQVHKAHWLPFNDLNRIRVFKRILRGVTSTLLPYEGFKLLDSRLLTLNARLCLERDSVVSVKFLLQLYDGLITLIKTRGKRNHDVTLLQEQLLISVNLSFAFFDLVSFPFNLVQLGFILLPDPLLLLFERSPELGRVLNLLATWEDLRVHGLDLVLEHALLFLGLKEFMGTDFECIDSSVLIGLRLLLFSFQLCNIYTLHATD